MVRATWICAVALMVASAARATPVVSYTLSLNESASGTVQAERFAIYATVSQGDNSGLFSFSIDLSGTDGFGGPTTMTIVNRPADGTFDADPADPNYDPGAFYLTKYVGFGAGRAASASAGTVTGMQDLSKGADLIPLYGVGQVAHNINDFRPPPDTSTGVPVAYGDYLRVPDNDPLTSTDNPYGNPFNRAGVMLVPPGSIRIATGRFSGNAPSFELGSINNASVWGLHTTNDETEPAMVSFCFRDFAQGGAGDGCVVPEPGMVLAALGGVFLLAWRRQ